MSHRMKSAVITLFAMSCSATVAAITLVSVEDEISIGRQADAQVRKEFTASYDNYDYWCCSQKQWSVFSPIEFTSCKQPREEVAGYKRK
jgi:hypothetical protein